MYIAQNHKFASETLRTLKSDKEKLALQQEKTMEETSGEQQRRDPLEITDIYCMKTMIREAVKHLPGATNRPDLRDLFSTSKTSVNQ